MKLFKKTNFEIKEKPKINKMGVFAFFNSLVDLTDLINTWADLYLPELEALTDWISGGIFYIIIFKMIVKLIKKLKQFLFHKMN